MLDDAHINAAIANFIRASRELDHVSPSFHFHDYDMMARLFFMNEILDGGVLTYETLLGVFAMEDEDGRYANRCWTADFFMGDAISPDICELLTTISDEPGMEHAAGNDLVPKSGEFVMLIKEGPASHVCAAAVFRLSVSEGERRSEEDDPWTEQKPGPTVNISLEFRATTIRRHLDPEHEQVFQSVVSAHLATSMRLALANYGQRLEEFGQHAWVTLDARTASDLPEEAKVSASLIRTIQNGLDIEVDWMASDYELHRGLDMVEMM